MSNPPEQPPTEPDQPLEPDQPPLDTTTGSHWERRKGALTAVAAVALLSLLCGSFASTSAMVPVAMLTLAPVVAFACILLGSLGTISARTRKFAVGFLTASAILLIVTAGGCAAFWSQL